MRANEFITEIFQPGKNWEWRFRGSQEAAATFVLGDREYIWQAFSDIRSNPTKWELQFKVMKKDTDAGYFDVWGMTSTGNSTEVMSTVVDITREFLNEYGDKVLELTFNSKKGEDSRTSLYARMIKRLLPDWNLYTRQVKHTGTEFHLTSPRAYELHQQEKEVDEGVADWAKKTAAAGAIALGALGAGNADAKVAHPTMKPAAYQKVEKSEPGTFNALSNNIGNEITVHKAAKKAGMKGAELAQFLAQMKHESWDFGKLKEKSQPGVKGYFAKRYDMKYSPKTAKILGNVKAGDGERYHGRGFVQLTGRDNYRMASEALGIDLLNKPELAARPEVAAKVAVWYWNTRVKPHVSNFNDTAAVTKRINPAMRGVQDRNENFKDYMRII